MEEAEIAVVGAGVLGLACAARLARNDRTVVVLESAPRYGTHTSSRNSEVIHAGIYYPPGSLKSRLCREGRERLYAMAPAAGIFARKLGKYIVATNAEEAGRLKAILSNAEAAGAEGLRLCGGDEVRRKLPYLRCEAALWSPETGIVDSEDLMGHFARRAEAGGAIFLYGSPLTAARRSDGGWTLTFGPSAERMRARWVINAAGLFSDKVAAMAGVDVDAAGYRIHWCKGRYFRLKKEVSLPHLVYPVPVKHGLGIHLTPDREGRVRLGPDTEFTDEIDYDVPADLASAFAASVRRYWPDLADGDLLPDTCGIRPKLTGPQGGFRDFVITEEAARGCPGLINLIGMESPGLTASPAVAEAVAAMIE